MKMSRVFGVELEINSEQLLIHHTAVGPIIAPNRPNTYNMSLSERRRWNEEGIHPRGSLKLLPGWKQVYDGSCGAEFVSPPINSTSSVAIMCDRIKRSGLRYSFHDTGLHVHVQALDLEGLDLLNLGKFCRHFDRAIWSLMTPGRDKSEYCQPYRVNDDYIERQAMAASEGRNFGTRYFGINLMAFPKHGTVEFRYAKGTLDPERIEALVEFYTKVVDWVKESYCIVKSPKIVTQKRRFMLDLVGISRYNRNLLLKGVS